jgi:hypothetical protein
MVSLDDQLKAQRDQQATEVAEAEERAVRAGKERFDLGRLERLLEAIPGSRAETAGALRRQYYLVHAHLRTLAEYAELLRRLDMFE